MPYTPSTSFNGTPIIILADGNPRKSQPDVSTRHIPGGNATYVDIGGQNLRVLDLAILFLVATDGVAFEAQQGVTGTLITADGTYTALLTSIQRTTRALSTTGDSVLQCEFILL